MASKPSQIAISASRRTDIPAFYLDWFMAGIDRGEFRVTNPYNRQTKHVPATPDKAPVIVFWSKNFELLLSGRYGERLVRKGYHLFFNFTVNSESPLLEMPVPPLRERLGQLDRICRIFDPGAVHWRFDPICFFKVGEEKIRNNMNDFLRIADQAAASGVRRCITSFMDAYPKIRRRTSGMPDFQFVDVGLDEKIDILKQMQQVLAARNMVLETCCEKEILAGLGEDGSIQPSSCIPSDRIMALYGCDLSVKKDGGQRTKAGCGCRESIDVGSYDRHPCFHNCLFCYANPTPAAIPAKGSMAAVSDAPWIGNDGA